MMIITLLPVFIVKNFRCEACGVYYNYFDFIKNYFGLRSDEETKAKMRKLQSKKFP